ncbi:MBL fold metallo-hydrolase [Halomonas denitrificans]|nr:MBL fold metallo-hydrolase [Halomonas denitrificans]
MKTPSHRRSSAVNPPAGLPMRRPGSLSAPLLVTTLAVLLALAAPVAAQRDFSEVEIRATAIVDGVHVLEGAGGNLGLVVGEQGAFLIDDQYAPLTEKIRAAVAGITDAPVRFVFNTHWHGDHTGGNENLAESGSLIVAHDNVRERLSAGQFMEFFDMDVPPAPDAALPVVTFNDEVTFHLGGHTVHAIHLPGAHTDGDAVVHLREANVIHTGDIVFYGMYPFIDYGSGGSLTGMVDAVDRMLAMADDETRFIPGHGGPVLEREQVREYRDMLATVLRRLQQHLEAGLELDAIQAEAPTADFDDFWGGGFIGPERWVELNVRGMKGG